ncbi:MAG TPA: IS200/IS605 family transposase [Chitinophagaceae bacterium]
MANTYTQIHIQSVFAVKYRACIIQPQWECDLYKYITGIISHYNHKVLAINGMPDHLHLFFGMRPTQSLSDLLEEVKGASSKWINNKRLTKGHFEWQSGFSAFSYSKMDSKNVIGYIENQKIHHKKINFMDEYKKMLTEFEVDFDEKYLFKELQ